MEDKERVFNRVEFKAKRQALRRDAPPAERLLWRHLRGGQLPGLRFRRQYGVGPYVLDFYCPARRLAVEVDGDSHGSEEAQDYDAARTDYLRACGIRVLRVANAEVYQDAAAVAACVAAEAGGDPTSAPTSEGDPTSAPTSEGDPTSAPFRAGEGPEGGAVLRCHRGGVHSAGDECIRRYGGVESALARRLLKNIRERKIPRIRQQTADNAGGSAGKLVPFISGRTRRPGPLDGGIVRRTPSQAVGTGPGAGGRGRGIGPPGFSGVGGVGMRVSVLSTKEVRGMEIKRSGSQPSEVGPGAWFTGTVRVDPLFTAPEPARVGGASVTFEPGARTAWHTHPLGQTLIVTAGLGWARREGGPVEEIRPGDVIWFAPGERHWHGATPTTAMTHIAIQEQLDGTAVAWMEHVSDEQYQA